MAQARRFRAIKGVRDILPPETSLWNWFEAAARDVMESYGFREIRLSMFEETEVFARSVGYESDIVAKEMYSFDDQREQYKELGALRDLVTEWNPNWDDRVELEQFAFQVSRLIKHRDICSDPVSISARNALSKYLAGLQAILGAGSSEQPLLQVIKKIRLTAAVIKLGSHITLRPEATASVVRAYIEHGMHTWPGNVKLYYVGPMFRRERPQKGRYRQFYQIGAEVLGQSDHPAIDAELIEMLTVLLERCHIERWTLLVNSIGCANCRPKYVARLREALLKVKDKLGPDSQRRIEANPLRVLDSKLPEEQPIIDKLPKMTDYLDAPCREHFEEFQRQLKLRGIPYTLAPRLVRGLDYYTRTTFEITSPVLGAQNALVGGGRYDGLSELLGGPPAKGIGFALGEDRFILAMQEAGKVDAARPVDVLVAWIGGAAYPAAVQLARRLRTESLVVEVPPEEMKLKKSLGLADKLGARYAVLLGENELASGHLVLRRMADGEQKTLTEAELLDFLESDEGKGAIKA